MKLTPRYGSDPIISIDGDPEAIARPLIRQRERLVEILSKFDEDRWRHPSRCAGWSNRDVIVHLDSTNAFWGASISGAVRGKATRYMESFDPVASPAEWVAGFQGLSSVEVCDSFTALTNALVDRIGSLDSSGWSALGEAPVGHVSVQIVAHHALWDAWVHERDVLLPLGIVPAHEPDEVRAALRYAASLGPAFALGNGISEEASLRVTVSDPADDFVVVVGGNVEVHSADRDGEVSLSGDAVALTESLSLRQAFDQEVPEEYSWMFRGLEVFGTAPS